MSIALITPTILKWARERAGLEVEHLAQKLSVHAEKLDSWEDGNAKPTFNQAKKIANSLHIPLGYLFLEKPPQEELLTPDLRTLDDGHIGNFSVDLRDVISDVLRKQDWYKDYLIDQDADRLSFVGKYDKTTRPEVLVDDIVNTLGLTIEDRKNCRNWEAFVQLLSAKSEDVGIWVMRSGKVGNNTHRILDVMEFRGFAVCDDLAPVVFINGADAKAAQIFTLIHELVHLWIGESGVSNLSVDSKVDDRNQIEKLCDSVAAEILVPRDELIDEFSKNTCFETLARCFKVSSIVVARRCLDLNLISEQEFFSFYEEQKKLWNSLKTKKKSGGSFYKTLPIANGRKFTQAVIQSVYSHRSLMRDGARLLGTTPATFENYARQSGMI